MSPTVAPPKFHLRRREGGGALCGARRAFLVVGGDEPATCGRCVRRAADLAHGRVAQAMREWRDACALGTPPAAPSSRLSLERFALAATNLAARDVYAAWCAKLAE
jgi:hypothetical protein